MEPVVIRSDLENLYDSPFEDELQDDLPDEEELETLLTGVDELEWENDEDGNDIADEATEAAYTNLKLEKDKDAIRFGNEAFSDIEGNESDCDDDDLVSSRAICIDYYNTDIEEDEQPGRPVSFDDVDLPLLSKFTGKNLLRLTKEEENVINNCKDPKLKKLLILNRINKWNLEYMYRGFVKAHTECSNNIMRESALRNEKVQYLKSHMELHSMAQTYTWRLGAPYFKTKQFFGARPNRDIARKRDNKEYCLLQNNEGRKWTAEDQLLLHDTIVKSYFNHREKKIESDIRNVLFKIKHYDKKDGKLETKVLVLQKQLKELRKDGRSQPPPLNCDSGVDWNDISVNLLKGKHSHIECKSFWNIYLHPLINKTDWLAEENLKIIELVEKHKTQNWDLIAKELGTNRSGYLIAIHYNTKLCDKFNRQRFMPDEDQFLIDIVETCRLGDYIPWGRVAGYFQNRSKHQLYHRYRYYLSYKDVKKGTFTEAEDILLAHLTDRMGKDFSRISELMPHRTSIQLRNRYNNYLKNMKITLGNFTFEDDETILNYVAEFGLQKWSALANQMKRTRAHVRQRYMTLKKWIEREPNLDIKNVPRRRQDFLSRCQQSRNVRIANVLKELRALDGIPTLITAQRLLRKINRQSTQRERKWRVIRAGPKKPPSEIDRKLIDFFMGTCKVHRDRKTPCDLVMNESGQRIIKLLEILGLDTSVIKSTDIDEYSTRMKEKDFYFLQWVKTVYHENMIKLEAETQEAPLPRTLPSTSQWTDPLSLDIPRNQVKALLPPSSYTNLGLRLLIVKFHLFKNENKHLVTPVRINSKKTVPPDPIAWKLQQNLLQYDSHTRNQIQHERDLFFRRFYALFKWPSILSKNFPETLQNRNEVEDDDVVVVLPEEPRKIGRPMKKVYTKVMKMVEARKLQRQQAINEAEKCEKIPVPIQKKRGGRGREPYKSTNDHPVNYIPRRSHIKIEPAAKKNKPELKVLDPEPPKPWRVNIDESKFIDALPNLYDNVETSVPQQAKTSKRKLEEPADQSESTDPLETPHPQQSDDTTHNTKRARNNKPVDEHMQSLKETPPQPHQVIELDDEARKIKGTQVSETITFRKHVWSTICQKWSNTDPTKSGKEVIELFLKDVEELESSATSQYDEIEQVVKIKTEVPVEEDSKTIDDQLRAMMQNTTANMTEFNESDDDVIQNTIANIAGFNESDNEYDQQVEVYDDSFATESDEEVGIMEEMAKL